MEIKKYKINIIGEHDVGKSLLSTKIGNKNCKPIITVAANIIKKDIVKDNIINQFLIHDKVGPIAFDSHYLLLPNTDGIIFVYDITNSSSLDHFDKWIEKIYKILNKRVPIVLFGNKNDLEHIREIYKNQANEIKEKHNLLDFFEGSAKTSENVDLAFLVLAHKIIKLNKSYVTYNQKKIYLRNNGIFIPRWGIKSILELDDLFKFKDLEGLSLPSNMISKIEGVDQFLNLEVLDLNENKLKKISGLENNNKLEDLELNYNQIEKIEGISNLKNLKYLDLSYNQIKKIENLNNCANLKYLDLSFNDISKIEGLSNLTKLVKLYLSINPSISKIENLDTLENLQELILQKTSIKKLEGLSTLKKLKFLSLYSDKKENSVTEIEGLENLISLDDININTFHLNSKDVRSVHKVIILRFACMIKTNDYHSIEDWKDVFKKFPAEFIQFEIYSSDEEIEWFIKQCSANLLSIIEKILIDPQYIEIREGQELFWKNFQKLAHDIFHNIKKY